MKGVAQMASVVMEYAGVTGVCGPGCGIARFFLAV